MSIKVLKVLCGFFRLKVKPPRLGEEEIFDDSYVDHL